MKTEHGDELDEDWVESPFSEGTYAQEENPMLGEMPGHPLHVKVVDTQSQNVAAEFAAWSTIPVPLAGVGNPAQLCPHKYHRVKAKFNINWGATIQPVTVEGTIVPGSATNVPVPASATITMINVSLSAADANTLSITVGAQFVGDIAPGVVEYSVSPDITTPGAVNVHLSATATAAGFITVLYTLSPVLYLANKADPLTSGALQNVWQLTPSSSPANIPDYDGQQALYVVGSVAGILISVLDETYGTVQ